jgi:hypothetical protein
MGRNGDTSSVNSWGDRPRPKGLGTKHLFFDVAKSGYVRESIKAEQDTRNKFYGNKLLYEKPPNVVFGETAEDCKNQYLVKVPADHETFNRDPETGKLLEKASLDTTLKGRNQQLVEYLMNPRTTLNAKAQKLADKIHRDTLKAKRDCAFYELRQHDNAMAVNCRTRELSCIEADLVPKQPELKNYGAKTFLRHFPNERSVPRFTQKTPSQKPGFA